MTVNDGGRAWPVERCPSALPADLVEPTLSSIGSCSFRPCSAVPRMSGFPQEEREAPPEATTGYALRLPIVFAHGTGVTLAVSREEVHFTTPAALAVGQRLTGHLRFPAEDAGAVGTVLRYVARVSRVRQPSRRDDAVEATARFEQLAFVPGGAA